ncbi:DUF819 family protein [Neolewinella sp.]|uniref:DUF819 family protein n=1 Tax=Neolewinella sp. TaxID=2993543 RepID=UPI003B52BE80
MQSLIAYGFALTTPVLATLAARRGYLPAWCSGIVLCYAAGILLANLRLLTLPAGLLEDLAGGSMLIGLPLLLLAVRPREVLRHAPRMLLAFGLCCLAGLTATICATLLLSDTVPDSWKVAGMLTGLYTGGTPNVQAIGLALEAPADYLVLIQAADVLLGGAYLLALITFLPSIFARIFPPTPQHTGGGAAAGATEVEERVPFLRGAIQLVAAAAITATGAGLSYLVTGSATSPTFLVLVVTSLGLSLALTPLPRWLGDTYPLGEYFVLIFCVAIGLLADFRTLVDHGLELLYFSAVALGLTTLLHLLLAKLARVDRDTFILSYVAAVYGPVFVVQVAAAIGNRRLLATALGVSLLGFGIGNYLGIGVAWLLRGLLT